MSALGPAVHEAKTLDLFAGSGALGLEALSRGADRVVFVERSKGALRTLEGNIELLGAQAECRIVAGDAMAFARRLGPSEFDIVLADPPYDQGFAQGLLELFEEKGFARELWVEHRSAEVMPPRMPRAKEKKHRGDRIA